MIKRKTKVKMDYKVAQDIVNKLTVAVELANRLGARNDFEYEWLKYAYDLGVEATQQELEEYGKQKQLELLDEIAKSVKNISHKVNKRYGLWDGQSKEADKLEEFTLDLLNKKREQLTLDK